MENTVAKKYYRFGVLEGNHVEERFGLDHAASLQVCCCFFPIALKILGC